MIAGVPLPLLEHSRPLHQKLFKNRRKLEGVALKASAVCRFPTPTLSHPQRVTLEVKLATSDVKWPLSASPANRYFTLSSLQAVDG